MDDIIEEALQNETEERQTDADVQDHDDPAHVEFESPVAAVIGYGPTGVEIAGQGCDHRYPDQWDPDPETHLIEDRTDLDDGVGDPDYAILLGAVTEQTLRTDIEATLPDKTTTITIPILPLHETVQASPPITAGDTTIPYDLRRVTENNTAQFDTPRNPDSNTLQRLAHEQLRELIMDLLTMLTAPPASIIWSPPIELYDTLATGGLTQGFSSQHTQVAPDDPPSDVADALVASALDTPVHSGHIADAAQTISFLVGGPDLTVKQAGTIEDAIGTHTRTETTLFAADITEAMAHSYRLTLLVT